MQTSRITSSQWQKVLKALYYSFTSGFVGGFTLAATNALSTISSGGSFHLTTSLEVGLVVAGVVGGLNALAVTVKQLFSQE